MNAEIRFKDKRLLEALEYIDEKYIDDVFDFLKEPAYSKGGQMKISPFKHWRHYLAAAACLLVLALAMPLFTHLPEIIDSFAAGWGEGTEEVTDENGIPYTYPMFVDDLEPISAEEMIKVNEAYMQSRYDYLFKLYYNHYKKTMDDSEARAAADEYVSAYLTGEEKHVFFNEKYFHHYKYYGIVNGYAVLVLDRTILDYVEYEMAGYTFAYAISDMFVYLDGNLQHVKDAYDSGLLSDEDIKKIYERDIEYRKFRKVWLDEKNKEKS